MALKARVQRYQLFESQLINFRFTIPFFHKLAHVFFLG